MDPKSLDPRQALARAVAALTDGPFDGRDVQGAQANALESIAWSLAGLLADRAETAPVRIATLRPAPHADGHLGRERAALMVPLPN